MNYYQLPNIALLSQSKHRSTRTSSKFYQAQVEHINQVCQTFGFALKHIEIVEGPNVITYKLYPQPGARVSKIKGAGDQFTLALSSMPVRILMIPNQGCIGLEVPKAQPSIVTLRRLLSERMISGKRDEYLPLSIGRSTAGKPLTYDLHKMPHVLIAGATGQGKSVCINSILISLLYQVKPYMLKLCLIDPKKVELTPYEDLGSKYLVSVPGMDPVATTTEQAQQVLEQLCAEMDYRYELLRKARTRNIIEYNTTFLKANHKLDREDGHKFLPFIVVVIDELADLMLQAKKEIEPSVARLAQMARAVGIHLVVATQRPSVDILTGVIKANFPTRISFRVSSGTDSRVILDEGGAENLIGRGDALLFDGLELTRFQGAFVSTGNVNRVIDWVADQQTSHKPYELHQASKQAQPAKTRSLADELLQPAARFVVEKGMASTSMLRTKFSIGHNRATRLMARLEEMGIVGEQRSNSPRLTKVKSLEELEDLLTNCP